jgi:hypothetical protein
MKNGYAIIDNEGGWLVNSVIWDGNLETWQPPEGTHAVPIEDIDMNNIPSPPECL